MEHTAPFKRFMHDLICDLGSAQSKSALRTPVPSNIDDVRVTDYRVEITEGDGDDVLFLVKLDVAAGDLQQTAMQIVLHHNAPGTGESRGTLGLHPQGAALCIWRRENLSALSPRRTAALMKELVLESVELGNRLRPFL